MTGDLPLDDEVETWTLIDREGEPDEPLVAQLKAWSDEREFVILRETDWELVQQVILGLADGEILRGMEVLPVELEDGA